MSGCSARKLGLGRPPEASAAISRKHLLIAKFALLHGVDIVLLFEVNFGPMLGPFWGAICSFGATQGNLMPLWAGQKHALYIMSVLKSPCQS